MSDTSTGRARRLAEIAERAKKFAGKNYEALAGEYPSIVDAMAAFAASEVSAAVQAERTKLCKALLAMQGTQKGDRLAAEFGFTGWH